MRDSPTPKPLPPGANSPASPRGERPGLDQVTADHRAEIVERLYEVALDPIRLEDLMEVWEGRLGPMRVGPVDAAVLLDDPEIEAHARRASVFLDRFEATRGEAGWNSVLQDFPRTAAFITDGGAFITAANPPAATAFGLREDSSLNDLPFGPEDIDELRDAIRRCTQSREEKPVLLRLRSARTDSPVILRVSQLQGARGRPMALVTSTELVWPEGFDAVVQEAFALTGAEVEIVRGLTLGQQVREIAENRGRSADTVRTQLKSIHAKTETHGQAELVRLVLGLMDVAMVQAEATGSTSPRGTLEPRPFQSLTLADGRRLEWIEFGAPDGAPVLYTHLDYGLIRWPAAAEAAARAIGLRIVVPVRAGYGRSDLHARGTDNLTGVTLDYAAVLDHLRLRDVAVITLGADLRFAANLSILRPDLVTGILGCAAQLPLRTAAQYERMDKWQRFILANARYAPKVLPFLVQAGFSLARRLGKEAFFTQVNGGSAADMETFARPDVRDAMLEGSEVCLARKWSAHEAFTREAIGSERDWSAVLRNCRVPVILLQGDQDPQTPMKTIEELAPEFPNLRVRFVPNAGQLLFFAHWRLALVEVQRFVVREARNPGRIP